MSRLMMMMLAAGCCLFSEGDAGGAGSGAGSDGGTGGEGGDKGGKPDEAAGLKSALEKERAANKELRKEVSDHREKLSALQKDAGTVEELKAKLAESDKRLSALDAKGRKQDALDEAMKKAKAEGLELDAEKARRYLDRVGAEKVEDAAKEVVEMFGVKKAAPAGDKGQEQERGFKGQPADDANKGKGKDLTPRELAELYTNDKAAYNAYWAAKRAGGPFGGNKV